ncbi:FAD-dependent oxidoreductase [Methylicorpusculum oleiharenae]|uniref:FAD-dependent oxidoreductase n=1 Tax=Methylicorpusculum oleiharenae TaxID=1338687 RepID=UPI001359ED0B|nr:FAD-dependent oxidoreductase [Methylicorpusculum oleiharenae]MCD2451459.1 FAD-dependent oxidoreductase [Methylicorpusculum oleiharenae]
MNRRQALQTMMALGALGLSSCAGINFRVDPDGKISAVDLPAEFDEIDHFQITHTLRDGRQFSVPAPSLNKDVVIVGGGISGLTTLKNLAGYDALLVEKENDIGGNSRRRKANGIHYPLGAIVNQGSIAPFTDFFTDLDIPFEPLEGDHLSYHINGCSVANPLQEGSQRLPVTDEERISFRQLGLDLAALSDPVNGIFFPRTENKPGIKELDRLTFGQYLAQQNYTSAARHFMKLILSSRLGENGDKVSAWAALYILSTLRQPAFTLPGGHGVIAEKLHARCLDKNANAILTGFTVINIENKSNGKVWVTGVHKDESLQTIAADCVVVAAPKMYAKYAVRGLAEGRPKLYDRFNYNAYLVAQVELTRPVAQAFETVSASHFSRFIIAADWLKNNRSPKDKSHLTVYVPYPGKPGRISLYSETAGSLAKMIIGDLHEIMPQSRGAVQSIYLHRWGHPMVSCAPGMDQLCAAAKQPFGRVVFAHSDSFGISGLYSAVWSGMEAGIDAQLIMEEQAV